MTKRPRRQPRYDKRHIPVATEREANTSRPCSLMSVVELKQARLEAEARAELVAPRRAPLKEVDVA